MRVWLVTIGEPVPIEEGVCDRLYRTGYGRKMADTKHSKKPFFKKYWVECLSVALLLSGTFLLLERLEIKAAIVEAIMGVVGAFDIAASYVVRSLLRLEGSDFVGISMLLAAAWLLAYRVRQRTVRRHARFEAEQCPRCSVDLKRAHRTLAHRLVEVVFRVRIRRFTCSKCGFRVSAWRSQRDV